MVNVREIICEAASDGLSPELAANMLLEPSRWEKRLFDPARDLATVYKQYLRGELGVGVLADAVQGVLTASNDMSDLADEVIKTYGTDATPGDVPDEAMVDSTPEDEQVEVLVRTDTDEFTKRIVDHITKRWSAELLSALYEEVGPPRPAWQVAGAPRQPEFPASAAVDKPRFRQQKIRPDTLQAFEQGKFFNNVAQSAYDIAMLRKEIARLYQEQNWGQLAQVYRSGGDLDTNLAALAGDLMVLKDITDAAVAGGYADRPVGGTERVPTARAFVTQEAWQPALLDPQLGQTVSELLKILSVAQKGRITYRDLQQQIRPFVSQTSPVYKLAKRGSKQGAASTPFTWDQRNAQKLAQGTGQLQPEIAAPQPQPEAPGLEVPAPEPTSAQAPAQPARSMVAQAAGSELGDMFGGTEPQADLAQTFHGILGLRPDRSKQFVDFLRRKGLDPQEVAGSVSDAYRGLRKLGLVPENPERFKGTVYTSAQKAMQKYLKHRLDAGETPEAADLIRAMITQLT